jgi:hypothetical protein
MLGEALDPLYLYSVGSPWHTKDLWEFAIH